jgi:hypothetical protein
LLDAEIVIWGYNYTGASTNMEYTAAYEMGRRLLISGWQVTSVVTD